MNARLPIRILAALGAIVACPAALAQETQPELFLETVMEAAAREAPSVQNAAEAYENAAAALSDSAAWKGLRLSGDASWTGDLSPEPGPSQMQDPSSYSASLNLPILESLSLSASARLGGDLSTSFSWQPLASSQSGLDLRLKLYKAGTALAQARKQARLDAMAAFMDVLSAEASRDSAQAALDKAERALDEAELSFRRGELSQAALARAQAAVPKAQAALDKAGYQVRKARLALAKLAGPAMAGPIEAGAVLDADAALSVLEPAWEAPVDAEPGKAVLDAQAELDYARRTPLVSGSGPVSVKGSLSSNGSFSLGLSIALDWNLVSGEDFEARALAVAKAEEALDEALEAQEEAHAAAVLDELVARLSLVEAESSLEAARLELAQALVLAKLGELSATGLAESESVVAKAELDRNLARITLAKARLSL